MGRDLAVPEAQLGLIPTLAQPIAPERRRSRRCRVGDVPETIMCLLIVLHRVHPAAPLIVGANRDERFDRPTTPMGVLREGPPRILGGRDEVGGGTWLAVNDEGVVAALTNLPNRNRHPGKRSRGLLPLELASHSSSFAAAHALVERYSPSDFNPAWLLVGDPASLHYLDFTGGERARHVELPPGIHVLENRPLGAPSPKVRNVLRMLEGVESRSAGELVALLGSILGNHEIPEGVGGEDRPPQVEAACVHAGPYGTRSSTIVVVKPHERPGVWYADGPPCRTEFVDSSGLWGH